MVSIVNPIEPFEEKNNTNPSQTPLKYRSIRMMFTVLSCYLKLEKTLLEENQTNKCMTPQNINKFNSAKLKKKNILIPFGLYTKKSDIKEVEVKINKSQHTLITKTQN